MLEVPLERRRHRTDLSSPKVLHLPTIKTPALRNAFPVQGKGGVMGIFLARSVSDTKTGADRKGFRSLVL